MPSAAGTASGVRSFGRESHPTLSKYRPTPCIGWFIVVQDDIGRCWMARRPESNTGNDGEGTASRGTLMLGTARDVDRGLSGDRG